MSDRTDTDTDGGEVENKPDTPTTTGTPDPDPATGPEAGGQDDRSDELPEWARKALSKANAEAASYRTKLRELETKHSNTSPAPDEPDTVTGLKQRNAALEAEVLRVSVAYEQQLPKALACRLRGNTRAELEADAKELAKLLADRTPADLRGGLDPTDDEDTAPNDPGALARRYGPRR